MKTTLKMNMKKLVTFASWLLENQAHRHKKLGHASMRLIEKLAKKELAIGLLKLDYSKDHICDACQMGKQTRNQFLARILSPQINPYNSYTWTYLDLLEQPASEVKESVHVVFDDTNKSVEIRINSDDEDSQLSISTYKEINSAKESTIEKQPDDRIVETVPNE
ncbi:hypothetical protein KY289_001631 [Solanum tuberosum]|nr:hypothetical protein KY289_001631 [Solanum tuberosum]